jgi:PAS domain S-box-containing protein
MRSEAQRPIHILVAEDSPTQAEVLRHLLESRGYDVAVTRNGREALKQAQSRRPNLLISDIVMPEMDGFHLCKALRAQEEFKDLPVILMTSLASPDDVIKGLDAGADNFIRKPYDERYLLSRIEYIISNRKLRATSKVGLEMEIILGGRKHRITSERQQILDLLISTYEDAVHLNAQLMEKQEQLSRLAEELEQRVRDRTAELEAEVEVRKRAEETLRRLASIVESSEDAIISSDLDGVIRSWNQAATRLFGYAREEALGQHAVFLAPEHGRPHVLEHLARARLGAGEKLEVVAQAKDGCPIDVAVTVSPVRDQAGEVTAVSAIIRDLSERKRLEEQVRQSQKLEAIGALAGGIAHDFNNILNVILGYGELALDRVPPEHAVHRHLTQIREAAERAAALTRQLLAFSRRQVLEPRVLDLNLLVSGLEKMLRRLISEDINLRTLLAPHLGRVKADPTQIEQVILNLVVNARDAMPKGGNLTISTANVELDEAYVRRHSPVQAGSYVMLAVSDSGVGIPPDVLPHIFEPFFTTKEKGKGTGLGLSTVYGIVRQSNGHVWVYSEPGKGTTFKVYLPLSLETPEAKALPVALEGLRGTETILLVEDADGLREVAREFLEGSGYTVLSASNGAEALQIADRHSEEVSVLVTDVIMPGMSGEELARKMLAAKPSLKVIYASGYTADAISHHGVLSEGVMLLEKPYNKEKLLRKIREALG